MVEVQFFSPKRKTRAIRRSRPLQWRDPEASRSSAALKLGLSTHDVWGLVAGLVTSNDWRDFAPGGKRVFFLSPITRLFTEGDELTACSRTAAYLTRPSSTLFQTRTPKPNKRTLVSREALRHTTIFSCQVF